MQAMVLPVFLCASVTRPCFGPVSRSSEEDGAEKSAELLTWRINLVKYSSSDIPSSDTLPRPQVRRGGRRW